MDNNTWILAGVVFEIDVDVVVAVFLVEERVFFDGVGARRFEVSRFNADDVPCAHKAGGIAGSDRLKGWQRGCAWGVSHLNQSWLNP